MGTQDSTIKKKLLFTLGCSFTEGDGAYPEEPFFELLGIPLDCSERMKWHGTSLQNRLRNENAPHFHKNGWPPRLVKKLGYDKLINVGKCASSTSYQVKLLFDKYWNFPFHHYETLMIIYCTDASRFSFYSGGAPMTFMAGNPDRPYTLSGRYAKIIQDHNLDTILEQIHHLKCLEVFCKSKGITLKIMNYHEREDEIMKRIYRTDVYMESKKWDPLPFQHDAFYNDKMDNRYHSPICFHPNKKGYELMAENVYNKIKELYPHLIRTEGFNNKPEMTWDGSLNTFPHVLQDRIYYNHEGLSHEEANHYQKTGKPFM